MKFHKKQSIFGDLIRVNASGSGLSLSIGVPGFRVHLPLSGYRKPGITTGIPGTGLSHSQKLGK